MILSRIDIHGFKSFATPTAIRFDPGITAIVGPNGCGKSNVVDAVRWVIGEQRARILRSEKMDNIIFNGTTRRHGLGMAEVQLTVQNTRGLLPTEYTTVALGRRLYRSGIRNTCSTKRSAGCVTLRTCSRTPAWGRGLLSHRAAHDR